jgi:hypothetical protein
MNIIKSDGSYKVESDSKKGKFYLVDISKPNCECPAFKFRKWCKHLEAVNNYLELEGKSKYNKILQVVKEFGPIESIKLIDMFDEEIINELLRKGELIEEKGMIRILN